MKRLQDEYADRGFQVVSINSDDEDEATVKKFVRQNGLEGVTVLLNGREVMKNTHKTKYYGTLYLIDRTGRLRFAHSGWSDGDDKALRKQVEELL